MDGTRIHRATAFLPGGQGIVFLEGTALKALTLGPTRAIETLVPVAGDAVVSPDGRWLAYTDLDSGVPHVYVSALASPGAGRTQVTPVGGTQPRWAPNGRELYYNGLDGMLVAVPINTAGPIAPFAPGPPTRVLERAYFSGLGVFARVGSYDVAPDGRFLMLKPVETPGVSSELPAVVVVKNWAEELKRRVPPPAR